MLCARGNCATTHPSVGLPAGPGGVYSLLPHSFAQSFSSFAFAAEFPFSSLLLPPGLSWAAFPPPHSPMYLFPSLGEGGTLQPWGPPCMSHPQGR